jgi:predicted GNAT family acetyltransferase
LTLQLGTLLMPVVRVKGVANPMQFPDDMDINDIREFLRKRFANQAVAGNQPMDLAPLQGQARASEQSLAQKAGQGISDALVDSGIISDRFGAQQIGQNVTSIGEFLPGIGDAAAGDEFGRALKQGDNFGMAMGALGAIPLVGDAAKKGIKAYHGTPNKFNRFDLDKIGSTSDSGMFGKGFYFTEDQALAETYAKKDGRVIEAELNLKNPYIINSQDDIPNIDVPRNTKEDLKNADKNYSRLFTEKLQSQGYDGVIDNMTSGGKQFVVFDPKNIRSLNPSTDKAMSVGGVQLSDAAKGTNQYGDDVFNISITKEGKKAGDIQYMDDGNEITILRSDVEDAGKGTGTAAYVKLVDKALSEGKTVKSDSIVSPSAAKVYEKLKAKGYNVEKASKLFNVRKGETTASRDSRASQRALAPTIMDDYGNRISAPFRVKGAPVYTIKP